MALFNKKEKIPDLPQSPQESGLPNLPHSKDFSIPKPPTNLGKNLTQEMAKPAAQKEVVSPQAHFEKSAIPSPPESPKLPSMPSPPKPQETVTQSAPPLIPSPTPQEISSNKIPTPPKHSKIPDLPKPKPVLESHHIGSPSSNQAEPVFIRIDKFQQAQKDFQGIKKSITEIESILAKAQELKQKQEAEFQSWSEDIENIKSKLSELDSEIFNKL